MAADRAAELTEAYRILSDAGRARRVRPRSRSGGAAGRRPPRRRPRRSASGTRSRAAAPRRRRAAASRAEPRPTARSSRRSARAATSSSRKATHQPVPAGAATTVGGSYDEAPVRGLRHRLRAEERSCSDAARARACSAASCRAWTREAVADAWTQAAQVGRRRQTDDVCVLLMGTALAPAGELADAIAEQRRQAVARREA